MPVDRLQRQRFEFKYRIPPEGVTAIRDFLRCHLELDEFCASSPDLTYPIHSLYLDSEDLRLYQSTVNGDRDRFKLRLRYYDEKATSPVYFEIKRRIDQCIFKQRACVRRQYVARLLDGGWPTLVHLKQPDEEQMSALHAFWHLMNGMAARPCSHVSYEREAWVCRGDNSIRVTFDRSVRCEPHFGCDLKAGLQRACEVFEREVILEIKFTDRFPRWLAEMVRVFGLMQGGAAKYVDGITGMGVESFCGRQVGLRPNSVAAPSVRLSGATRNSKYVLAGEPMRRTVR